MHKISQLKKQTKTNPKKHSHTQTLSSREMHTHKQTAKQKRHKNTQKNNEMQTYNIFGNCMHLEKKTQKNT